MGLGLQQKGFTFELAFEPSFGLDLFFGRLSS